MSNSFASALENARWIWADCPPEVNQYAEFRCLFDAAAGKAQIYISADWDFLLTVNGQEVGRGQFPDYPEAKTVSCLEVETLVSGKNVIAVTAYAPGENFSAKMKGTPGILVSLVQDGKVLCRTAPETWKARLHPVFQSGKMELISPEIGFTACYDARRLEDICDPAYDDRNWRHAVDSPRKCSLAMRPLEPLKAGMLLPSSHIAGGTFYRDSSSRQSFADYVHEDHYESNLAEPNGQWSVWDLGVESVGFAVLHVTAGKDGAVIDFSWGENVEKNRVRTRIGNRHFTMRIFCGKGRHQIEVPFVRLGCRYVQVNISGKDALNAVVHYAGLRDFSLSLPSASSFIADIPDSGKLREVGLRTLQCCMHFHYEDCPWREQSLYGYDSRNQMLYGYYAWGNYPFVRASLNLLGKGYIPSLGEINLCAPNQFGEPVPSAAVIPCFTRAWVAALREYVLYSGDMTLVEEFAPMLEAMFQRFLEDYDATMGLFRLSEEKGVWHFFEWTKGLCKFDDISQQNSGWHILHNLYTLEALQAGCWIFRQLGKQDQASRWEMIVRRLAERIHEVFYDSEKQEYVISVKDGIALQKYYHQSQLLPVVLGVAPAEIHSLLRQKVLDHLPTDILTFSPLPYFINSMFASTSPREQSAKALQWLNSTFMEMIRQGATTFWETPDGAQAFGNAGSLCHGWSSVHVGFYGKYVLGISPVAPGFSQFIFRPYIPDGCRFASGEIPTPHGPIKVAWEIASNGKLHATTLEAPPQCTLLKA